MSRRSLFQIAFLLIAGVGFLVGPAHGQQLNTRSVAAEADLFVPFEADLSGVEGGSASVGDVNEDGNLDLVITGSGSATLYLGDGQGGFTEAGVGLTGVAFGTTSSFSDVNEDESLDLVIAGDSNSGGQLPAVVPSTTLYLGDGKGGFTRADADLTDVAIGTSSAFGDVNEDGTLDLLITGSGSATLYLGNGEGGFAETDAGFSGYIRSFSPFGDVDHDGNLDVITTGWNQAGDLRTTLYLGNGTGSFTATEAGLAGVGGGPPSLSPSISLGDVNGDGHLDLVVTGRDASDTPTATLYLGNGEGGFAPAHVGLTGVWGSSSSFGDVNGDGNIDLVITGTDASGTPIAALYLGTGMGGFIRVDAGLRGVRNGTSSLGDVDNDGDLDLLITGADSSGTLTATLYENRADGALLAASASKQVAGDGMVDFGATGVDIHFSDMDGTGTVNVGKFNGGPTEAQGIVETHISDVRFTIHAGGHLAIGSGTEVRFDVETLDGIGNPRLATIYRRSMETRGPFTALPTTFASDANELVAPTDALGEFVLAWNTRWVQLESFRGTEVEEQTVRLTWTTAVETNILGFDVERHIASRSDTGWTKVGFVQGAGTTSEEQTYRFTDPSVPFTAESIRYRLRRVTADGTALLDESVTVTLDMPDALQLHAPFPNPMQSQATLRYEVPQPMQVEIAMYDVLGRRVATFARGRVDAGRQEVHLGSRHVSHVASGMYFIRLRAGGQTITRRLTVVR